MSEWLHHWLEPVTEAATRIREAHLGAYASAAPLGGGHVTWGAITTGIALAVVLLTARSVSRAEVRPAVSSALPTGFAKVLHDKWYVDEFYHRAIVRPILSVSRFAWQWIDAFLIDGVVNAVGRVTRAFGWIGSLFQTGQVTTYAFVLTLGALAILGVLIL
jgi:NADH-quinone oxidoreductase subunit L